MDFSRLYRLFRSCRVSPHSLINSARASRTILSSFNRKDAAWSFVLLPDAILNKQLFPISHEKRFIVILIFLICLARRAKFWDIWLGFRFCETSSLAAKSRSSNNCKTMLAQMKWLCTYLCLTDIEFVKARIHFLSQAASARILCSKVRSIGNLKKDFVVIFSEKQSFKNSLSI